MKHNILLILLFAYVTAFAQVAINTDGTQPDPSAMLDVKSMGKGLLIPRMPFKAREGITAPATGLMIYQTDNLPGIYYNSGNALFPLWHRVGNLSLPVDTSISLADYLFTLTNPTGSGIKGISTAGTATTYGIYGENASTMGRGVWGYAYAPTGSTIGVGGGVNSTQGTAVKALASSVTGTTYGVYASVASPDGFSGYFTGGRFYTNSNVGIGTLSPTADLHVNGSVRIVDGTQATGKVLACDGTGLATWDYAPGSIIKYTILNSGCNSIASFGSLSYTKIADIGTFSKVHASSDMEVTFQGYIFAQTLAGTGAHFELRVDGAASTNGRARANLKSPWAGPDGVYVSITGLFTGLGTGTHTVSMWMMGANGGGTIGGLDPGCWGDDRLVIKEVR